MNKTFFLRCFLRLGWAVLIGICFLAVQSLHHTKLARAFNPIRYGGAIAATEGGAPGGGDQAVARVALAPENFASPPGPPPAALDGAARIAARDEAERATEVERMSRRLISGSVYADGGGGGGNYDREVADRRIASGTYEKGIDEELAHAQSMEESAKASIEKSVASSAQSEKAKPEATTKARVNHSSSSGSAIASISMSNWRQFLAAEAAREKSTPSFATKEYVPESAATDGDAERPPEVHILKKRPATDVQRKIAELSGSLYSLRFPEQKTTLEKQGVRYIAVDTEKSTRASPTAKRTVMIWDKQSESVVGDNVYELRDVPLVGATSKFDTYSAEYVGSGR